MSLKKTGKILCHVCFRRYICPVKTYGDVKSGGADKEKCQSACSNISKAHDSVF